jgi:hypothetical protein
MSDGAHEHATVRIDVRAYEPAAFDQPAQGPALVRIHVEEEFSGDIEAQGVAEFLQTTIGDDQASVVGLERVSRSIRGCAGTFGIHDTGTLNGKTVSATWFVVPGSGTGDLLGLGGEGGFTAQLGEGAESRSTTGSNEPIARGLPPEIGDWHCGAAERHRGAPEPLLDALPEQTNTLPPENTGRRKNRRVRSVGR